MPLRSVSAPILGGTFAAWESPQGPSETKNANSSQGGYVMKNLTAVLSVGLVLLLAAFAGCGKKNPMEPGAGYVDKAPSPTATPIPTEPGKSTVVVKTMMGNNPISNVNAIVKFGETQAQVNTDTTGQASFVMDAEGSFTATIPNQGDLLESTLTGNCARGQSTSVVFQAGGAIGVTPTAYQYEYAGGTFPLTISYNKGANSLAHKVSLSTVGIPSGWTAAFDKAALTSGESTTLNVTVPTGAGENLFDLKVRGSAQNNAIVIDSPNFAIYRDWVEWCAVRVYVDNAGSPYPGINFTVSDSAGNTTGGTTGGDGYCTVNIFRTGSTTVYAPAQGSLPESIWSGNVAQAQTKDVNFSVNFADIKVVVNNGTQPKSGINFSVADSASQVYNGTTEADGSKTIRIYNLGNYSVNVPAQWYIIQNTANGSAAQGELKTHTFNVGSADMNVYVQHNGAAYKWLPVQLTDNNGTVQNISTDAGGCAQFHLSSVGNYSISIPTSWDNGIMGGSKTGTITQNQNKTVNFTGTAGSINLNAGGLGYVWQAEDYDMWFTYAGTGDLSYIITLSHVPALPALGSDNPLTQGYGETMRATSQSTYSRYHLQNGYSTNHSNFVIRGTKAGQNSFNVDSTQFYLSRGWSITLNLEPDWNEMYKYNATPPHFRCDWVVYITGTNVPNGTTVNGMIPSYSMPQVAYVDGTAASPVPFSGTVGGAGSFSIFGYNRGGGVPWKYDGTCYVVVNFCGVSFNSETCGFKY